MLFRMKRASYFSSLPSRALNAAAEAASMPWTGKSTDLTCTLYNIQANANQHDVDRGILRKQTTHQEVMTNEADEAAAKEI